MLLKLKAARVQFLRPGLGEMTNRKLPLPIKKEYYSLNDNS